MIHPPRPRPVTELFPESLRLSPKQRAVLDALDAFPNGAKVGEIAKALGMHTNTARGHLEELVAMKAVFAVAAPTTGRGRPQLIYKLRIPNNKTIADQYLALINIMAQHLEDSAGSHAKQLAQQIGREAGARLIDEGSALPISKRRWMPCVSTCGIWVSTRKSLPPPQTPTRSGLTCACIPARL